MHELGVTKSIAEVVLRHAEEQSARAVRRVNLVIGEMRNLDQEWVQRYFDRCVEGTIAQGAQIEIQSVPITFYCSACGATFQLPMGSDQRMCCAECGSDDYDMITGGELLIKSIEIT